MKRILTTGGTGYIGSHTVVELLQEGYQVSILDNLSNSHKEVLNSIEKITGIKPDFHPIDLCDAISLKIFLSQNKFDAVIHFAAFKSVGESVDYPLRYYKNNLLSLINLLENCISGTISNIVFSSSCSVYGEADTLPISESSEIKKAESPYGNTKQIGEEILLDTVKSGAKINAISLRYFNPAGAHSSALIGEYPLGVPNNLVPVMTQTAIGKRESFTVFGDDYNTPDGTCVRDFIHVVDVAQAHVKAIQRFLNNQSKERYEVFNIGSGLNKSVLEAIHAFEKVNHLKLNYLIGKRRIGDVEKVFADTNYAETELGWKSKLSFEDIMQSAWNWEQRLNEKK
jgi:UDP-glucose 4-epimerase